MTLIDPSSTALLVMDCQPAILGRVGAADALLGRAVRAIDLARGAGLHVGHVRVAFEPADVAKVPATNTAFSRATAAMPADAPQTQFHERVAPRAGDIVVRKTRVGAFSTTDLHAQLRAREVTTLVLAGVSTSGVVQSTVCDAADRDYRLIVLSDGCADPDEDVHRVPACPSSRATTGWGRRCASRASWRWTPTPTPSGYTTSRCRGRTPGRPCFP